MHFCSEKIVCIFIADECKEKNISEGNCAQWILVTLSSKFIAKELDTHSFSWFCSYLPAQEKGGGMEREGKTERGSGR